MLAPSAAPVNPDQQQEPIANSKGAIGHEKGLSTRAAYGNILETEDKSRTRVSTARRALSAGSGQNDSRQRGELIFCFGFLT
jgi:hypothetical protein